MVSNGTWKDYSFSSGIKEVSFNIYHRASDRPILRILKNFVKDVFEKKSSNRAKLVEKSKYIKSEAFRLLSTISLVLLLQLNHVHRHISTDLPQDWCE